MGGGELNCGQDTPLASVCQSGSGPTIRAGAGRYSAFLDGIQPGAWGGSASVLRCLPGATGTTRPPTERWDTRAGRWSRAERGTVLLLPVWQTRPFAPIRDKDEHLSGDGKPLGVQPRTAHLKAIQRGTRLGAAYPQVAR